MESTYWISISTPLGKLAIVSTSTSILQIEFQEGGHPDHPFKIDKNWIEVKDPKKVTLDITK
jgi:hypothetical protein